MEESFPSLPVFHISSLEPLEKPGQELKDEYRSWTTCFRDGRRIDKYPLMMMVSWFYGLLVFLLWVSLLVVVCWADVDVLIFSRDFGNV